MANQKTQTEKNVAEAVRFQPDMVVGPNDSRLNVMKTYKVFIDGKFPRTESGRYFVFKSPTSAFTANVCQCSRKDLRDAVTAARNAQPKWAAATAYNRGQIIYRVAEMLEARRTQFLEELMIQGLTHADAEREVAASVDRLVYYAGWSDKYQQLFSTVNPVASQHFNFSMLEPVGVVNVLASDESSLLGLVTAIAPVLVGGNTCVVLASSKLPLSAITFAEVLATSDVPAGIVNILTGFRNEFVGQMSSHMDVNAVYYFGDSADDIKTLETNAALNVKRVKVSKVKDLYADEAQGPYEILNFQETKTTWHPVGN